MSARARTSLGGLLIILVFLGLLLPDTTHEDRIFSGSSYGQTPWGYGALYDVLLELELPVERSLRPPTRLPAQSTIWWIDPQGICKGSELEEEGEAPEGELAVTQSNERSDEWQGASWVVDGGTAVVFLSSSSTLVGDPNFGMIFSCDEIAGFPLPSRSIPELNRHQAQLKKAPSWPQHLFTQQTAGFGFFSKKVTEQGDRPSLLETMAQYFQGDIAPEERTLESGGLLSFEEALDWEVRGEVDAQPFVLERELGAGRVVVVADSAFLRNAWLDHADAAPLAVDLVRAYGVPVIDEYEHGFRVDRNTLHYLLRSTALPIFLGLAVLGALFAWRGNAYFERSVEEVDLGVPTLETFVDSVATLYSRTRDFERVFERYRELTLDRIRRHCGLPNNAGLSDVSERLERDDRISHNMLRWLVDPPPVRSQGELRSAVLVLDALFEEVSR